MSSHEREILKKNKDSNAKKGIKVRAIVFFDFTIKGKKADVITSIEKQIVSDMNVYWQNDDDTAQMTGLEIKRIVTKKD